MNNLPDTSPGAVWLHTAPFLRAVTLKLQPSPEAMLSELIGNNSLGWLILPWFFSWGLLKALTY